MTFLTQRLHYSYQSELAVNNGLSLGPLRLSITKVKHRYAST